MIPICEHKVRIEDGASQNETYKIGLCEKCHKVLNVQPRNEKPKEPSVWDFKDRRITRMSVLKVASERLPYPDYDADDVIMLAELFMNWVYEV